MERIKRRRTLPIIIFTSGFFISLCILYFNTSTALTELSERTLRRSTESSHGDMVLFASNALKNELEGLSRNYEALKPISNWKTFAENDLSSEFRGKVEDLFQRTSVIKLKVYARDGLTIFSTDPSQIGEEKSEVEEVTHALRGRSSSQFSFRENFMTISGNRTNIEVVSSYHPLKSQGGTIVGVVEIYSDRSSDFQLTESLVKTELASIIILIALIISIWLVNMVYYSLQKRSEDM
jgi:hypothetical protein